MALSTIVKDAAKYLGTGVPGMIYNGVTNGNWLDITPGYSAANVIKTQAGNVLGSSTNTPQQSTKQTNKNDGGDGTQVDTSGTGTGSGSSALGAVYDNQIGRINSYIGALPGQRAMQENIINKQADAARAGLDTSFNRNTTDLNTQENQINQNKARSINDLVHNGRSLMQAMNNKLGTMGAGSSSASDVLVPYGIAQAQNKEGANINQQVNTQLQAVNTEHNRLKQDYDTNVAQLQQERMSNLLSLGQQFSQISRSLQDQLSTASAAKAQALNGQYAATVDAVNQAAQQIENSYQSQLQQVNDYYTNYTPTVNTDLGTVSNNVSNINTSGITVGNNNGSTANQVTAAYLDPYYKQDQLVTNY